jgi:hypothetical protein
MKIKRFNQLNEEIGPDRDSINKSGLQQFLEEFLNNINNKFILSTLYRMLETGKFFKEGREIFILTDEEKNRLNELKPLLDNLINDISKIKEEIKKESDKEINKMYKSFKERNK